jgi:hypothetical protein
MGGHQKHLARADAILGRSDPPAPPRAPPPPPGPIPTIGDLLRDDGPRFLRLCCGALNCTNERVMSLEDVAAQWGLDTSTDRLRKSLVCRCGHKGGRILRFEG